MQKHTKTNSGKLRHTKHTQVHTSVHIVASVEQEEHFTTYFFWLESYALHSLFSSFFLIVSFLNTCEMSDEQKKCRRG